MRLLVLSYFILLLPLRSLAGSAQCKEDSDCMNVLMATCSGGVCMSPNMDSDCDGSSSASTTGVMISFGDGSTLCSVTCSSNSDCITESSTTWFCSASCRQCLTVDDCNALGFVNHICHFDSGFCFYPSGTVCASNTTYCPSLNCYDDGYRCWKLDSDCSGNQITVQTTYYLDDSGNSHQICTGVVNEPQCVASDCQGSNSNCISPNSSVCSAFQNGDACVSCQGDSDCTKFPDTPFCINTMCQTCELSTNDGCNTSYPYCFYNSSAIVNQCAECLTDSDCKSNTYKYCSSTTLTCGPCSSDNQCTENPETPICEGGLCQKCSTVDKSYCTNQTSVCHSISNINSCVECITDSDCTTTALPHCSLSNYTCVGPPLYIAIDANLFVGTSPKQIFVTFNQDISAIISNNNDSSKLLQLQIDNLNSPTDFNYTWTLSDSHTITIDITYGTVKLQNNKAYVLFNSTVFTNFTRNTSTTTLPYVILPSFFALSAEDIAVAQTYSSAVQVAGAVVISGALPTVIASGSAGALWNFVSVCQIVNYLLYLNVVWPENAQMIFGIFATANLNFIPNPFANIIKKLQDLGTDVQAPAVFNENGMSGLFLQNSGSFVMIWTAVAIGYCLIRIAKWIFRSRCETLAKVAQSFLIEFEWGVILRTISSSYVSLLLSVALQMTCPNFENWMVGMSTILAVGFGYFLLVFILTCCRILYHRPKATDKVYERKYAALFEDFKRERVYQRYFIILILIRRVTYVATLVGFSSNGQLQVPLVLANSIFYIIAMVFCRPYEKRKDFITNLGTEILIFGLVACALVLVADATNPILTLQSNIMVGWAVVALCGCLVGLNGLVILYDTIVKYKELFFRIKKYFSKKKDDHKEEAVKSTKRARRTANAEEQFGSTSSNNISGLQEGPGLSDFIRDQNTYNSAVNNNNTSNNISPNHQIPQQVSENSNTERKIKVIRKRRLRNANSNTTRNTNIRSNITSNTNLIKDYSETSNLSLINTQNNNSMLNELS